MSQRVVRMVIFGLWLAFWLASSLLLLSAPAVRSDASVSYSQALEQIPLLTGIWLPALTCLAGFWFGPEARERHDATIPADRARVALVITAIYLVFAIGMLIVPVYVEAYSTVTACLPAGESFDDKVRTAVQVASIASPLALAPVTWLTARRR